jgi:predicted MFS family arabinose efflux permease
MAEAVADAQHIPAPAADVSTTSKPYRTYALTLLVMIYTVNFLDRQIVTNLMEPIKNDLKLTDSQVGAMAGFYFALLYTIIGLPVARLADKGDRPWIMTISLAVWSGFTLVAAFAQNFLTLAISRAGVGVGEAGCTPTAHSLISEYFPKNSRARALAIYSMGISIGSLLGMALGGLIADVYGWRVAFMVAGAPGLLLAVLSAITLIEPRRRLKQMANAPSTYMPVPQVMKVLIHKPTFWLFALGAAFAASVSYAHSFYLASFFLRNHMPDLVAAAAQFGLKPMGFIGLAMGLAAGIGGVIGSWLGGWWCDKFGAIDKRQFAIPVLISPFICLPVFWYLCSIDNMVLAFILLIIPNIGVAIWYGPVYGGVPGLVPQPMRATTVAILLFIINIIGLGGGPTAFGWLSDLLTNNALAPSNLDVEACRTAVDETAKTCAAASASGVKGAIYLSTSVHVLSFACFFLSRYFIRKDMEH